MPGKVHKERHLPERIVLSLRRADQINGESDFNRNGQPGFRRRTYTGRSYDKANTIRLQ